MIELLKDSPNMTCEVAKFMKQASKEDLLALTKAHVVKVERHSHGIYVKFESKLTEGVILEAFGTKKK